MSRRVGYGTIEERSTTEEEKRARARERVAGRVRQGKQPRARHTEDDLRWAFKGQEEELAARERDEQAKRRHSIERRREVQTMTAKVLQEWDDQRHRDAELEAQAARLRRAG